MRKIKNIIIILITYILVFNFNNFNIYAQNLSSNEPVIEAKAAILSEVNSKKILYKKAENEKMYPASITKVLTALVALDHLKPDEFIVCGPEIGGVPIDSSKAGHFVGETLKVENAIRGLIIPSGNETACVVAKAVAEKVKPGVKLTYPQAEKIFTDLMNEKAKSLGAKNSNFVNPHGYFDENHYSTAYDLMLIGIEGMKNPLIAEIAKEREFIGFGAGSNSDPSIKTQQYDWKTHNELIAGGKFNYPYAIGVKTGFTTEAGKCVMSYAVKDGTALIAIVLNSTEEGRWNDSIQLFEYGYNNFATREIQASNVILGKVRITNSVLGESNSMPLVAKGEFKDYLSKKEFDSITKEIKLDETRITPKEKISKKDEEEAKAFLEFDKNLKSLSEKSFLAPVKTNDVFGKVIYKLDGKEIFSDNIVASKDVSERSFKTDFSYYSNLLKKNIFTLKGLLILVGSLVCVFVLVFIFFRIKNFSSRRKNRYGYKFRKRY